MSHRSLLIVRMLDVFNAPMTQVELCAEAGLAQATVSRYLKRMMEATPREAHISAWAEFVYEGRVFHSAVYSRGPGENAECPTPAVAKRQEKRARRTTRQVRTDRREEAVTRASDKPPQRDALTAALFGAMR